MRKASFLMESACMESVNGVMPKPPARSAIGTKSSRTRCIHNYRLLLLKKTILLAQAAFTSINKYKTKKHAPGP